MCHVIVAVVFPDRSLQGVGHVLPESYGRSSLLYVSGNHPVILACNLSIREYLPGICKRPHNDKVCFDSVRRRGGPTDNQHCPRFSEI